MYKIIILLPLNSFLLSKIFCNNTISQQTTTISTTIMFIILFILMYFMLIRPQIKKEKKHKELLTNLTENTEIITIGGLIGIIKKIHENYVIIELSKNIPILITKQSIIKILPIGTIKMYKHETNH